MEQVMLFHAHHLEQPVAGKDDDDGSDKDADNRPKHLEQQVADA